VVAVRTPYPFLPALLFHATSDVVGVGVEHAPRAAGRSGYGPRKLMRMFSNLLLNNSSLLLQTVGALGFACAFVSVTLAAVVIVRKLLFQVAVTGWSSLMATLLLIGGVLLLGLGVIGEYLVRIVETSEGRPSYLVRRRSPPAVSRQRQRPVQAAELAGSARRAAERA
jgi:hypothetical protein